MPKYQICLVLVKKEIINKEDLQEKFEKVKQSQINQDRFILADKDASKIYVKPSHVDVEQEFFYFKEVKE
jgi:hypothetical protein